MQVRVVPTIGTIELRAMPAIPSRVVRAAVGGGHEAPVVHECALSAQRNLSARVAKEPDLECACRVDPKWRVKLKGSEPSLLFQ